MSINPFPFAQVRDFAATSPLELGSSGTRAVTSTRGSRRAGQDDDSGARGHGDTRGQGKSREQREHDAQRQALANLILSAFDASAQAAVGTVREPGPRGAQPHDLQEASPGNARLEQAILEFMYALFHALDQSQDSGPVLEFASLPVGSGPAIGRTGRSAFGERLDQLARRVGEQPFESSAQRDSELAGFDGINPRLARSYAEVLRSIRGDTPFERPGLSPRAQLCALLLRLANAMHIAPTLGYGIPSTAGAMLRVRA